MSFWVSCSRGIPLMSKGLVTKMQSVRTDGQAEQHDATGQGYCWHEM